MAATVDAPGRFRIYLGAAPGVGKTYAMLSEGHRRHQRGADVAIGFVECHGRQSTEELIEGLEVIPRRVVEYRGSRFEEMDLDAVLARHPEVALVDELAHTNVPGSGRHEKRWQDVIDLLDAGIDVITTVNIQHLESIADAVERIIEVPIRERVPDWVLRKANQIELVDSSPEQLRRRMLHGNIYSGEQAPRPWPTTSGPTTSPRSASWRSGSWPTRPRSSSWTFLRSQQKGAVWETHERILVGVTTAPGTDAIVRRAARMANRIKADLEVLHVMAGREAGRSPDDQLIALRQAVGRRGCRVERGPRGRPGPGPLSSSPAGATSPRSSSARVERSRWQELLGGGSDRPEDRPGWPPPRPSTSTSSPDGLPNRNPPGPPKRPRSHSYIDWGGESDSARLFVQGP